MAVLIFTYYVFYLDFIFAILFYLLFLTYLLYSTFGLVLAVDYLEASHTNQILENAL